MLNSNWVIILFAKMLEENINFFKLIESNFKLDSDNIDINFYTFKLENKHNTIYEFNISFIANIAYRINLVTYNKYVKNWITKDTIPIDTQYELTVAFNRLLNDTTPYKTYLRNNRINIILT